MYKINVDGAFNGGSAGAGVIIRDHGGEIIASIAYNLNGDQEAAHANLYAIWKGVLLAQELCISHYKVRKINKD